MNFQKKFESENVIIRLLCPYHCSTCAHMFKRNHCVTCWRTLSIMIEQQALLEKQSLQTGLLIIISYKPLGYETT